MIDTRLFCNSLLLLGALHVLMQLTQYCSIYEGCFPTLVSTRAAQRRITASGHPHQHHRDAAVQSHERLLPKQSTTCHSFAAPCVVIGSLIVAATLAAPLCASLPCTHPQCRARHAAGWHACAAIAWSLTGGHSTTGQARLGLRTR